MLKKYYIITEMRQARLSNLLPHWFTHCRVHDILLKRRAWPTYVDYSWWTAACL